MMPEIDCILHQLKSKRMLVDKLDVYVCSLTVLCKSRTLDFASANSAGDEALGEMGGNASRPINGV